MLLRDAVGETLRDARNRQNRTLRDVSTAANVSLGYLSEVERGRKEASSELLASICDALDLELSDFLDSVSRTMRTVSVADKRAVVTNSIKAGMGSSNRERRIDGSIKESMKDTRIEPEFRIVVPYDGTRPGAPVA
ncbi:helix-turn-helix domain-containing protein [Nakamurella multipartita]|jgi:transcriptional regulator with XRE-family HTH domain|uniref:Transcriptional regulator, XRE family n=1 Tax=Nakamurella multipartita (strain ATCC 700099 / DSM 44233 / CIP 104796 / JCM 9543 / NBRC 105858 / Y-104) TaxID=479431 RepID=C8X9J7_NAKMY|nr:helix-turn-helix transcriptional regulator [Nakamurella multipartita]ACV79155.1 transcriptional regulator, XRE family [Nakamurella multipartita DSM 44233]HOZ56662.1 helix-turn-helix transcriptional regulator [Nakamurella multipartita]